MTAIMGESALWRLSLRLMVLSWIRLYVALYQAAVAATLINADSPFNLWRYKR